MLVISNQKQRSVYFMLCMCVCVLGRSSLFRQPALTSSLPPDSGPFQQSAEQVCISTLAEVHSDSDSFHASWGDGIRIPTEEVGDLLDWEVGEVTLA